MLCRCALSVLAVSSYNTVAVLLLLHVLWKNIKSQSAPSSSCSLQLLLSWSSWPWWPSVTLQSLNAWMEKSSTKLHLQVYPTFKWNTQCYYSVCLFTHSNLRSSKFTRLLLDSDVVCDVACCQIFIFNVYSLMINDYKTNEKNEATDSAEWIYSDNHYNWRHGQRISLRQCKYTNNSLIPKSIVHWYIMGQHACALWWHSVSLAVVLTHAS